MCKGWSNRRWRDAAEKVGAAHGIVIAPDPEPDRNSFIRTDQYSFVQAGVPALAFKFGWTAGSPEYKAWRGWLAQRYHSTEDDLSQPVDLVAAAQFNTFWLIWRGRWRMIRLRHTIGIPAFSRDLRQGSRGSYSKDGKPVGGSVGEVCRAGRRRGCGVTGRRCSRWSGRHSCGR